MGINFNSGGGGGGGGGRETPRKREPRKSPIYWAGGPAGMFFPVNRTLTYPGEILDSGVRFEAYIYTIYYPHALYTEITEYTNERGSFSTTWGSSIWKDLVNVRVGFGSQYLDDQPPDIDLYIDGDTIESPDYRYARFAFGDTGIFASATVDKYGYGGSVDMSFYAGDPGDVYILAGHPLPKTIVSTGGLVIDPEQYAGQSVSRY